jgi:hypothetical protein
MLVWASGILRLCDQLTGIGLVPLIGLLDAPAYHLHVLAEFIVAEILAFCLLQGLAVLAPERLDLLGDNLLYDRDNKLLRGSCEAMSAMTFQTSENSEELRGVVDLPILSVPSVLTSRKQKGKSSTLRAKYTPTADQPYSLDSFFNLALSDRDCSAAACCAPPLAAFRRALEDWNVRLQVGP